MQISSAVCEFISPLPSIPASTESGGSDGAEGFAAKIKALLQVSGSAANNAQVSGGNGTSQMLEGDQATHITTQNRGESISLERIDGLGLNQTVGSPLSGNTMPRAGYGPAGGLPDGVTNASLTLRTLTNKPPASSHAKTEKAAGPADNSKRAGIVPDPRNLPVTLYEAKLGFDTGPVTGSLQKIVLPVQLADSQVTDGVALAVKANAAAVKATSTQWKRNERAGMLQSSAIASASVEDQDTVAGDAAPSMELHLDHISSKSGGVSNRSLAPGPGPAQVSESSDSQSLPQMKLDRTADAPTEVSNGNDTPPPNTSQATGLKAIAPKKGGEFNQAAKSASLNVVSPVTSGGSIGKSSFDVVSPSVAHAEIKIVAEAVGGSNAQPERTDSTTAAQRSANPFPILDSASPSSAAEVHTSRHGLTVGFRDDNLGWMEIRTQSDSGRMAATLLTSSADAHKALASELPAIGQFLEARQVQMHTLTAAEGSAAMSTGQDGGSASHSRQPSQSSESSNPSPTAGPSGSTLPERLAENAGDYEFSLVNLRV